MKAQQILQTPFFAYDNSQMSNSALTFLDTYKHQFTKSFIVHVHKPKKVYILQRLRGPAVYEQLKKKYPDQTNPNITIQLKQSTDKTTNVILLETMIAKSCGILFIGFVGSKGMKPRNNDLSSVVRQFVYDSKCTLGIIKHNQKSLGKVLFLFDGSQISYQGLQFSLVFCRKFKKQLTVLYTYNQDLLKHSKHLRLQLKNYQQQNKIKFQIIFEQKELLQSIKEKTQLFDWIILNRNGYRGSITKKRFVGSNTTKVLEEIPINTIII